MRPDMRLGMAIAAMIKMMATTIRSSTREIPFCLLFMGSTQLLGTLPEPKGLPETRGLMEHFVGHFWDPKLQISPLYLDTYREEPLQFETVGCHSDIKCQKGQRNDI